MVDLSNTDTVKFVHSHQRFYSTAEHSHADHAMILIPRSGTMRVIDQFSQQHRSLERRCAYYVASGVPHQTKAIRSDQKHFAFYLNKEWELFLSGHFGLGAGAGLKSGIWSLGQTTVDLLHVLEREDNNLSSSFSGQSKTDWKTKLSALIAEDCLKSIKTSKACFVHPEETHRGTVDQAIEILVSDLADPPSIDTLAELCGISRRHLVRVFRQQTGKSIHGFLKDQRYRHAYDQVINTQWSMQQIALSVGVESAASFSTDFREKFGVSPSALRKRNALACN